MATIEERIFTQALKDQMPHQLALLIVAQAKHETNNFASNVFKTCNNAFGYKYVGQKLSTGRCTGSPEGNSYAKYASIEDSTREVTGWIKRRQKEGKFPANLHTIQTARQYADLLKKAGYYGDTVTNYTAGLVHWFKANITAITSASGGLLVIILLLFF